MAALESRLKGAGLPPEASKVALRDLARLKKMQPSQPEYTVRDVRPMFFSRRDAMLGCCKYSANIL